MIQIMLNMKLLDLIFNVIKFYFVLFCTLQWQDSEYLRRKLHKKLIETGILTLWGACVQYICNYQRWKDVYSFKHIWRRIYNTYAIHKNFRSLCPWKGQSRDLTLFSKMKDYQNISGKYTHPHIRHIIYFGCVNKQIA